MAFGSNAMVGTRNISAAAIPRTGSIASDAEYNMRIEFANQTPACKEAAWNVKHRAQARCHGNIFQRPYFDEPQLKTGRGNHARFHSTRGADKEHFSLVARDELVGHGKGRNNMTACSSAGNEDAKA